MKYLNDINNTSIDNIIGILGQILDTKASRWIENVGGWKNFMWYVKKDYRTLNRIVTVILVTISIYTLKMCFVKILFNCEE